jgi:superfamily II DNA or RNA helicase
MKLDLDAVKELFDEIRESAGATAWSQGVQLARRDQVVEVPSRSGEGEIALRVDLGRGSVDVYLRPSAADWECECAGNDDVCAHVAASVIALRRALEGAGTLRQEQGPRTRMGYCFAADGRTLTLRRIIVGQEEAPEVDTLAALVARDPQLDVKPWDKRAADVLDAERDKGAPNSGRMRTLLRALQECDHVWLDGAPVTLSAEPLLPVAVVEPQGSGFVVSLRRESGVTRVYTNGVALCGRMLRPVGEPHLQQRERDELLSGRFFGPEQVSRLVSEVLPDLGRRIPVDASRARLPVPLDVAPRLHVEVTREGDALTVCPEILYGDPAIASVKGDALVPLVRGKLAVRRLDLEEPLRERARRELGIEVGRSVTLAPGDAIALRPRLDALGDALTSRAHGAYFLAPPLALAIEIDGSRLDVTLRTRVDGREVNVDLGAALRAWQADSTWMALPGGGFSELPRDFLATHGRALADLLASRDASGAVATCALPDLARLCDVLERPRPPALEKLRALVGDYAALPEPDLPGDLQAELRSYQRTGVAWLTFLRQTELGGLLADDMGLGKTLQALCALRGRALVVCPTSVLYGWAEQIARFRPHAKVSTYHGPSRALDRAADITLTTYAILRLDAEVLAAESWDFAVLDEAQAIKNPDSQVARAAYRLTARVRLTLTGTPVENRLDELWSQLRFTNPALLGDRAAFRDRYARPIEQGDAAVAAELRQRIRPFVLRRLKREVAPELPPRTEAVLRCELRAEERAVYDAIRAATRADVVERLRAGGSVIEALEALLRLRQAACHPALVPGQRATGSSKLDLLLESLTEAAAEGSRALVFSQWTSLLDLVEPHLRDAHLAFLRLDGSTTDRGAIVERFQAEDGPPILLISLRAGGTGLNLTAADHVFLLDPWWNPAVEDQAADRAHRIGQGKPVFVYRLVAIDTVEERILALQQRKRAIAEAALSDAGTAASITRDDLLALLEA